MTIRLRYAPSPTGFLHIGGARTALFNWAYARRFSGTFILRIEDTDAARSTPEFEVAILEGLRWLGLDWDEGPEVGGDYGPYRQTERFDSYRDAAQRLQSAGHAYPCFCSAERLTELRERQQAAGETPRYDGTCRALDPAVARERVAAAETSVLRFRVPETGETVIPDLVAGDVRFLNEEVDDWIMVRADGSPTYNFVVVCDDAAMEITHVLRGEEHLTNTPKQMLLFEALGLTPPIYAHLPLMLGSDKKKLSKRTGDTSLQDYRDKGYPAAAVANFLSLQGWSLDDKTTVFAPSDLIENFDPARVSRGGSVFDPKKFLWMAGEYVHAEPVSELADHCAPFVVAANLMTADEIEAKRTWFEAAIASEQERIRLYSELPERLAYLFCDDDSVEFDPKAEKNARKHANRTVLVTEYVEWLRPQLGTVDSMDRAAVREGTRTWIEAKEAKFPMLFQPLRCALTGAAGGADLFDVMALLGPERTVRRIETGIRRLG